MVSVRARASLGDGARYRSTTGMQGWRRSRGVCTPPCGSRQQGGGFPSVAGRRVGTVVHTRPQREKEEGYERSLALWRKGDYALAEESFETFLQGAPMHSLGWVSYSRLILATRGFKEARRVLFRGLETAGDIGMLLQALGLAELKNGNDLTGVILLEESVRYFGKENDGIAAARTSCREDNRCLERARLKEERRKGARVLRWKAVSEARSRAIHSFGKGECGTRFRQVRSACRRRIGMRVRRHDHS